MMVNNAYEINQNLCIAIVIGSICPKVPYK